MSESRYQIIQQYRSKIWQVNSPVILIASNLLYDRLSNHFFAQAKFQNISDKTIASMSVKVSSFNDTHIKVEETEFVYVGLEAGIDSLFADKSPLQLQKDGIRQISIQICWVEFADLTRWRAKTPIQFEEIPEQRMLKSLLDNDRQYRFFVKETGCEQAKELIMNPNYWICCCGALNGSEHTSCRKCGRDLSLLKRFAFKDALISEIERDKSQRRIKQKKAAATVAKAASKGGTSLLTLLRNACKKTNDPVKALFKVFGILVVSLLAICLLVYGGAILSVRNDISKGNIDHAERKLTVLSLFSNQDDNFNKCTAARIEKAISEQDISAAGKYLNKLPSNYKGYEKYNEQYLELKYEPLYQEAMRLISKRSFDKVKPILEKMPDYKDARQYCAYSCASSLERSAIGYSGSNPDTKAQKYRDASQYYLKCDGFLDADEAYQRCLYQGAVCYINRWRFTEGKKMLEALMKTTLSSEWRVKGEQLNSEVDSLEEAAKNERLISEKASEDANRRLQNTLISMQGVYKDSDAPSYIKIYGNNLYHVLVSLEAPKDTDFEYVGRIEMINDSIIGCRNFFGVIHISFDITQGVKRIEISHPNNKYGQYAGLYIEV